MSEENDYLIKCFFEGLLLIMGLMTTEAFSQDVWDELDPAQDER
jgi:hypothetical protein